MGVFIILGVVLVIVIWANIAESKRKERILSKLSPEEQNKQREVWAQQKREANLTILHGAKNSQMVCPHCNSSGSVRTKPITQKKGISGGKATAALLTGGISILATGLSRKEKNTQAHCDNCQNTWFF